MVTQSPAARTATAVKPATRPYRPHIRIVDAERGLYTVQSERYVYVLYQVNVVAGTCECAAGQQGFRNCKRHSGACKHLQICRAYAAYRAKPCHLRPALSWEELAAEFAALPVPAFDFSRYRGAEALLECFA